MTRRRFLASAVIVTLLGASGFIAHAQDQGAAPATKAPANTTPAPVNLNTASSTDLAKLPGVGPATAARILEYRQKNGAFKKVEELMNIKGIGEKSFLKLKALVVVTPPKTSEK